MARKKRNKDKCNNGVSSNAPVSDFEDTMPLDRDYYDRERVFVCTGAPGNGFYCINEFNVYYNIPVPLSYSRRYLSREELENIVDLTLPTKDETRKSKPRPNVALKVWLVCGVLAFVFALLKSWFFALPLVAAPIIVFFATKRLPAYSRELGVTWKHIIKERDKFFVTVGNFRRPAIEDVDYYAINADKAANALDEGIARRILSNYAKCLRNPGCGDAFCPDNELSEQLRVRFRDVCGSFEVLIRDTTVWRVFFQSDDTELDSTQIFFHNSEYVGSDEEADSQYSDIVAAPASLYIGTFDFISSSFNIPVFDFGGFRFFLYPTFAIKAIDPFSFYVVEYKDLTFSYQYVKYTIKKDPLQALYYSGRDSNWRYLFHLERISLEFDGESHSILCNNQYQAHYFASKFLKYRNKFLSFVS